MKFTWDRRKAAGNLRKHAVSFDEAASVFGDVLSLVYPDLDHSEEEARFVLIGMSQTRRILVVSHTDRAETVRIISARDATRKERRFYEENR